VGRLTHPFDATFDRIAHQAVSGKHIPIDVDQVAFNPIGVLDDVG